MPKERLPRNHLNFIPTAKKRFGFLMNMYNFHISHADDYYICFNSNTLKFEIYHERISYELYCCIGLNSQKETVELGTLLESMGIYDVKTTFQASSKEGVEFSLNKMHELATQYLRDIFEGKTAPLLEQIKN